MRKPELLAPGGGFLAAHAAIDAGADAVYLGLREFSARKAAQNFSFEQLRRIRQLTREKGRRVYVTVNTVIRQEEMPGLRESLAWLEAFAVDGVIVQDLGVCRLLAREFPRLPLHASTQMGVHNDAGLRVAEDLGIRRVILSRELPLERIRRLRDAHPGIELEVFIHGALCYSFSGACLASWALTGRSGNRGDCAQICRSRFQRVGGAGSAAAQGGEGPQDCGHFFSCRDLFLGRDIRLLADAGVDALKIEGRMKAPEYVFATTRLYRQILDRGAELPEEEYEELARRARLAFSREPTTGWLHAGAGSRLLGPDFPGHRGVPLGVVQSVRGNLVDLRLSGDLSIRDGLGFFPDGASEPVAFSVGRIQKAGHDVRFARKGQTVGIEIPPDAARQMPYKGQEIRHLSSRFLDLPQPREGSFPLFKVPLELRVSLAVDATLSFEASGFPGFARKVTVDAAARRTPFRGILESLLGESGSSLFRAGAVSFVNATGLPDDGIFVPPSELKRVKNELYAFLDQSFAAACASRGQGSAALRIETPSVQIPASPLTPADLEALSRRQMVSPPRMSPVPFAAGPATLRPSDLALRAGFRWLPLPPVIMDEAPWVEALERIADADPDVPLAVGLNNVSHLAFVSPLAGRSHVWFFADLYLYAANRDVLHALRDRVPRLLFAYEWIEAPTGEGADWAEGAGVPVVRISPGFAPPLFYSLGCYARHDLNAGKCFDECPRDFDDALRQGRNGFRLAVRDCVTYLFADAQGPARRRP